MTVKELIEKLQQIEEQTREVYYINDYGGEPVTRFTECITNKQEKILFLS